MGYPCQAFPTECSVTFSTLANVRSLTVITNIICLCKSQSHSAVAISVKVKVENSQILIPPVTLMWPKSQTGHYNIATDWKQHPSKRETENQFHHTWHTQQHDHHLNKTKRENNWGSPFHLQLKMFAFPNNLLIKGLDTTPCTTIKLYRVLQKGDLHPLCCGFQRHFLKSDYTQHMYHQHKTHKGYWLLRRHPTEHVKSQHKEINIKINTTQKPFFLKLIFVQSFLLTTW